ncbi:MAG TPA: hypothetical protein VK787_16870 [Puia sp.]|jgi:hypothetical protein|nr:hypothetical protein [Puia sp.]
MKIFLLLLLFFLTVILFSCKKNGARPSHPAGTVDTSGNDTAYYYKFQLDSVSSYAEYAYINGYWTYDYGSDIYVAASIIPSTGMDGDNCCGSYFPWDSTGFFEVIGGINNQDSSGTFAALDSLLSAGASLKYGKNDTLGVIIQWIDPQGKLWATNAASGDQTGSNFTITQSTVQNPSATINITASFNCILYDSAGNAKTLTNGKSLLFFIL